MRIIPIFTAAPACGLKSGEKTLVRAGIRLSWLVKAIRLGKTCQARNKAISGGKNLSGSVKAVRAVKTLSGSEKRKNAGKSSFKS